MTRYDFTITIGATAVDVDEAWRDAVEGLSLDPGSTPEEYDEYEEE